MEEEGKGGEGTEEEGTEEEGKGEGGREGWRGNEGGTTTNIGEAIEPH